MWQGYDQALADDTNGVNAVLEAGRSVGADAQQLAWAIELETAHTWSPAIRNPKTDAVGLIQFLPSTLDDMQAPDADDVARMSRVEQAPLIAEFFKHHGTAFHMDKPGDVLLAIFFPAAIGKPDTFRIAEPYTEVWKANAAYRGKADGAITAGSVRRVGTPPTTGGPAPGTDVPDRGKPDIVPAAKGTAGGSDWVWLALLWAATRKRGGF